MTGSLRLTVTGMERDRVVIQVVVVDEHGNPLTDPDMWVLAHGEPFTVGPMWTKQEVFQ